MKNKFLIFPLFSIFFFGGGENLFAQKKKTPVRKITTAKPSIFSPFSYDKLNPEQKRRITTFYLAWQTIKNNYFDQTFNGLNWEKVRTDYEPRVFAAPTDEHLHDLLQEMINLLGKSHLAIIPPEVFQAIENAKIKAKVREEAKQRETAESDPTDEKLELKKFDFDLNANYGIGLEMRLLDNQFVVTRVEANSAAAKAGIKIGYAIEKINDVSLSELLKNIEIYYSKIRNIKKHLPGEIVSYILNGEKDTTVSLTVSTESGQLQKLEIPREKLKGETISLGENYPEQFLQFETASLNEHTGYIKFNVFAVPVIEKFCAALTELKDKRAIIIDLRGNSGGILASMVGLGGMLTEKSIDLGTSFYKVGNEKLTAASKAKNFKGRLVFLVDNETASAAEIFAAALQENNRALIVGEKTAGEALPSVSIELPTGAIMFYPIANYKTRNGNFLEGKGVEPNFPVTANRKSLLNGRDAALDTALKIILEDSAFPKLSEEPMNNLDIKAIVPPPPPPALPKPSVTPKLKTLAEVTVKGVSPPASISVPPSNKKDEKSLQVIADFISTIGGEENLKKIKSYALNGASVIPARGTKAEVSLDIYRQTPNLYSEILNSEATGEIRQIYNDRGTTLQSDYGIKNETLVEIDTAEIEIFAPLYKLINKESFSSLVYQGAFDRMGKKAHVIQATTKENQIFWLAFDVETKMFVSYTGEISSVFYDDYRPVENVRLPFQINKGYMNIKLDAIELNKAIDASKFTVKENCYDKVN